MSFNSAPTRRVFLRITNINGKIFESTLHPGGWEEGTIVEYAEMGLRCELNSSGPILVGGGALTCELLLLGNSLPAVWGVESATVESVLAELNRCGREARFYLEWGAYLEDNKYGRKVELLLGEPQALASPVQTSAPKLYLWLCCEGWERLGPFDWLRFDDAVGVIVDQTGQVVARKRNSEGWFVNRPGLRECRFSNPTITIGPTHPHPDSGSHRRYLPNLKT